MKRIIILLYVIVMGVISIATVILHTQTALFFMNIFSADEGNSYYGMPVVFLTWIILLIPLFIFLIIAKLLRKKGDENITYDRTGIFVSRKKSIQSSLIGVPIYINDKKVGALDNGKTRFFDTAFGHFSVQAGKGIEASDKLFPYITVGKQLHFEMEIIQAGLHLKYVLKQV